MKFSTASGLSSLLSTSLRSSSRAFGVVRDGVAVLITPSLCRTCSLPLLRADAYPVCAACLAHLEATSYAVCWKCGDAIGMDDERAARLVHPDSLRCAECMTQEPRFLRASAFGAYRGILRQLIHLHKFEAVQPLAGPLGSKLAIAIADAVANSSGPLVVVAVPLFRGKRSFNQSVLLADVALRDLRRSHPQLQLRAEHSLLRRTRATESQSHLTPGQRKKNVRGAFEVTGDVRGGNVLLVDDVYTTGATAAECTSVLLRAGAASVSVATLARAHMRSAAPAAGRLSALAVPWVPGPMPGLPLREPELIAETGERKR